jgi:hypothetical protein
MDRKRLQELIQRDLDGELLHAERAELARVLLQDHDARRLQHEFRRTHELLRGIPAAEAPAGLREEILAAREQSARPAVSGQRKYSQPLYRIAAVVLAGVLVVGISEILRDKNAPTPNLQGSMQPGPQDQLTLRADNVEVRASITRVGSKLRLELNSTAAFRSEVIARIDPAMTTFVGNASAAPLGVAKDRVTIPVAVGSQLDVLEFSGTAPIRLELRSDGQLLGAGTLSVSE